MTPAEFRSGIPREALAVEEMEPTTIGARFAALRASQGLSLRDIHDRSGIAFSYVQRLESGDDWSGVSLDRVARLARAVGTTPGYLLGEGYLDGQEMTEGDAE